MTEAVKKTENKGRISIRQMSPRHKGAATSLLQNAFNLSAADSRSELSATYDERQNIIFAALQNGRLVGTIRCHQFSGDCLGLSLLAVDAGARKQGIGGRLVRYAEVFMRKSWMEGQQKYISFSDGNRKNNPDSAFYEKLGYKEWPDLLDEKTGDRVMYKWVKPPRPPSVR